MHVPHAQEQEQLLLGKIWVHQSQWNAMERQVPCCEPGILPGVGHRDDIRSVEMPPFAIASKHVRAWRRWARRVAMQPHIHIIIVELLAPQQASEGLPLHSARIL